LLAGFGGLGVSRQSMPSRQGGNSECNSGEIRTVHGDFLEFERKK
jgi:hypothetical protein